MDNSRIWLTSDPHFYHRNIIKYCNRPFDSIEEMNEQLINNWNSLVKKQDRIFCLGDFCLGGKDKIIEIGQRLNGRKILLFGNHDSAALKTYYEAGFETVSKYPIYLREYDAVLSHEPIPKIHCTNIHGHLHKKTVNDLEEWKVLDDWVLDRYKNISVDRTNYKPILITDLFKS